MGIFDFFKSEPVKKHFTGNAPSALSRYNLSIDDDNNLPTKLSDGIYKKGISGLKHYLEERNNISRLFNELTWFIRNGYTPKEYLNATNFMNDSEIKEIVARGYNDIRISLKEIMKKEKNEEIKKDYDALVEAINFLNE